MTRRLYRLLVPDDVARLIRGLHPEIKQKLRAAMEQLLADPNAGKALQGELEGLRSYRLGRFRLIYRMEEDRTIAIIAFGPRATIYEHTYNLVIRESRDQG